jgi:hypothetical protein
VLLGRGCAPPLCRRRQGLIRRTHARAAVLATLAALSMAAASLPAAAEEPLKIGFGMAETGPLAGTGKSALLAMTIWAEDVNAKGGLLGRQVKLVHYDDQSNPANVPVRGNARTLHREGSIPVGMVRLRLSPLGNCNTENVVPFGMPPDFVHNRFLQFSARPLCLSHCLLLCR